MKSSPIGKSQIDCGQKKKTEPKSRFREVIKKVSEPETKKKDQDPCLLDGPVTAPLKFKEFSPMQKISPQAALRTIQEITQALKPSLIHLSEGGISKTTLHLTSELLSEMVIEIDHYDTNPSCFSLTFRGNEKAQQLAMTYQAELANSLKIALPLFQCSFTPTTFPETFTKKRLVKSSKVRYRADNTEEK